jgi:hypothetical protein
MSNYRLWAVLASVASLNSACKLDLEGRACSVSENGQPNACLEGWSCCPGNVCKLECSDLNTTPSSGSAGASNGGMMAVVASAGATGGAAASGGADAGVSASNGGASDAGAPETSVVVNAGPEGATLILDAARVDVPAGVLTTGVALELAVVDLPSALPLGRSSTSRVYSIAPHDTAFSAPVNVLISVDATVDQPLMVLELRDGWQPLTDATYYANVPVPGAEPEPGGQVLFSTDHGGIFVVVVVDYPASMDLVLGDTAYGHECGIGWSSINELDPNGGVGPVFDTEASITNYPSGCPWPASNPQLTLAVMMRGFSPNLGLPLDTYDLADAASILALRVQFIARLEELPEGQPGPFQAYDSTVSLDTLEGPEPRATYEGFYESPLASGTVTVSRLPTVQNSGNSKAVYLVELSEVTLSAGGAPEPTPLAPFPPTIQISSATLTYSF